ncbi:hypothetical protein A9K75_08540 [Campylobacter fetus subsp. testudinum]|uniref:hypothetical protein n=1 Tax=Campylobacter fetus TaxID=196 RepID=UPI0008189290|nr:hypothetical protein [Campylobacter fetus]OCR99083.1 hypothetical protein A9K75_08540 [Campylobacter fetus subsp. testudinum]
MKKIFLILIFGILILQAACHKLPCQSVILDSKFSAIQTVQSSYKANNKAINELEKAYNEYKTTLNEQNKLLKQIQELKKKSLEIRKETIFTAKRISEIKNKNIDLKNE